MRRELAVVAALAIVATMVVSSQTVDLSTSSSSPAALELALPMAPPVGGHVFDGAIIGDPSCFENQLFQGTLGGVHIELPFLMWMNHTYWEGLWVNASGALTFDSAGFPFGMDFETDDLIWAYEIIAPMMGANSGWDITDEGGSVTPTYYGFTTYQGRQALCVTWLDVAPEWPVGEPYFVVTNPDTGYGSWNSEWGFDYSKRNSFQVLVVDRSDTGTGNFDLVYNYDSIQWQTFIDRIDSRTGVYHTGRAHAGWSLGIGMWPCDSSTCWKGCVDGRITYDPFPLPWPEDHWFPQAANGEYTTYLDSSPTGLAVTSTNSAQVGRHVFEIRKPLQLLWIGNWTHGDRQYVALGDSYQSGEGAGNYYPGTDIRDVNKCHRSAHAYPVLLHGWIPADTPVTLDFWACSNARIYQMYLKGIKKDHPPWNDAEKPSQYPRSTDEPHMTYLDRLGDETWVVTIGIGGNDVGFASIIEDCVTSPASCYPSLYLDIVDTLYAQFEGLSKLYSDIADKAPNATLFVLGYPRLFATDEAVDAAWDEYYSKANSGATLQEIKEAKSAWWDLQDPCTGINRSEQIFLNDMLQRLNRQIRVAAMNEGAVYIDIVDVGNRREVCSSDDSSEWFLNGAMSKGLLITKKWPFQMPIDSQSFHPNKLGHQLIAGEFVRQLAEPRYEQEPFIYPGELKQYVIEVIGGLGSTLRVAGYWAGSDVVITLVSPSGVEHTRTSGIPNSARTTGPRHEYIEVADPEPGSWTIQAYGADVASGGESFLLDVDFEPPVNLLPVGDIQLDRRGSTITVSAPGSFDPDGTIIEYWWDLGDGTLVTAPEVTHTYSSPGTYRVALILTDDRGGKGFVFLEDPITILELSDTTWTPGTPEPTPEPEPTPSADQPPEVEPEPGPDLGVESAPSPSPSPTTSLGSGSHAWGWGAGITLLLVVVVAVGGLWHRQRFSHEG